MRQPSRQRKLERSESRPRRVRPGERCRGRTEAGCKTAKGRRPDRLFGRLSVVAVRECRFEHAQALVAGTEGDGTLIGTLGHPRIFLCTHDTDMRKSFDSLRGIIRSAMHLDPLTDCLFVFKNKRGDRIKVIYWDCDGFAMCVQSSPAWNIPISGFGEFSLPLESKLIPRHYA